MKTLKNIFSILFLFAAVQVQAQTNKETTQRIIDAQNYVFVATTALPMNSSDVNAIMNRLPGSNGGGNINLTGSNYDVSVTKDSLVTYLPYYGRSFVARIGDREGGIKFKSKDFSYNKQERKKGGWTITMKPKDVRDSYNSNYSLTFNITANGYGTLVVTSNNQQPITFNGYLAEPKPKKN
jgi:hypothetical protein